MFMVFEIMCFVKNMIGCAWGEVLCEATTHGLWSDISCESYDLCYWGEVLCEAMSHGSYRVNAMIYGTWGKVSHESYDLWYWGEVLCEL